MFRGHTLRIVVGTSAGGGYDAGARVVAEYLGRHLAGHPPIVVENMPGAGGVIAANYLARQASPDGLTVGYIGENAVIAQLLGESVVQFDIRRFGIIGSHAGKDADVCVLSASSGLTLEKWRTAHVPPRMGVTSRGSGPHARTMLLAAALHLPLRLVIGYQGTAQIRLAIEGGEVDGMCSVLSWYKSGFDPPSRYPVVVQDGGDDEPLLAGVPSATRLAADDAGRDFLDLAAKMRALARYYVVPPGTSADVLALLRTVFDETMHDEECLRAMATARLDVSVVPAAEIASRADAVLGLPADVRQRVIALFAKTELP